MITGVKVGFFSTCDWNGCDWNSPDRPAWRFEWIDYTGKEWVGSHPFALREHAEETLQVLADHGVTFYDFLSMPDIGEWEYDCVIDAALRNIAQSAA